ncbi:MAG: hypothetical protein AAGL49_15560, partial [Pseudomonadota bacterium]
TVIVRRGQGADTLDARTNLILRIAASEIGVDASGGGSVLAEGRVIIAPRKDDDDFAAPPPNPSACDDLWTCQCRSVAVPQKPDGSFHNF